MPKANDHRPLGVGCNCGARGGGGGLRGGFAGEFVALAQSGHYDPVRRQGAARINRQRGVGLAGKIAQSDYIRQLPAKRAINRRSGSAKFGSIFKMAHDERVDIGADDGAEACGNMQVRLFRVPE